jgi:phosphatidate cytidylyltransferase
VALLKWRLISAAVIIGTLLSLLHLDFHHPLGVPGVWLVPLALLVSLLMVHELLDLWHSRADAPAAWPVYWAAPATVLAAAIPQLWPLSGQPYPPGCPLGVLGWPVLAVVLGIGLAFVGEMRRYRQPGTATACVGLSVLAIGYAGLLLSFLVHLRGLYSNEWGMTALLSVIVVVKMSDTGAYFTGRLVGRHKLAPVLSPGKTVEGALGAFVWAVLAALACRRWLVPALVGADARPGAWWAWTLFGLLVALTGMVGDLAESLLKRDAQRKDSSRWLPGLGGVLDVVDSVVFAAAPAYFFYLSGLIGPGNAT